MQSEKNQAEQDHRRDQQQGDPVKLSFKKTSEFLPDGPPAFFIRKIFAPSHSLSDYVDYDASKIGINALEKLVD